MFEFGVNLVNPKPSSAEIGPDLADSRQNGPMLVERVPGFGNSIGIGTLSSKVSPNSAKFRRSCFRKHILDRFGADRGPVSGRFGVVSARFGVDCGSRMGLFGADLGGRPDVEATAASKSILGHSLVSLARYIGSRRC